jgi:protein-tyrosine phosphatase
MVCTGNICRSPMAAGMLEQGLPEALAKTVSVSSAGTHALHGDRAQPFAIETMRRRGIDISDHRARLVSPALIRAADLIAVMEPLHVSLIRRAVLSAGPNVQLLTAYNPNSEHSEVPDPMGAPLKTYEACADLMQPCIDGLIRSLEQTCL